MFYFFLGIDEKKTEVDPQIHFSSLNSKKENDIQEHIFSNLAPLVEKLTPLICVDGSKKKLLGKILSFTIKKGPRSLTTITFILELKITGSLNSEARGQLLNYLLRVNQSQPFRPRAVGALRDGEKFDFMIVHKDNSIHFLEGVPGLNLLLKLRMLQCDLGSDPLVCETKENGILIAESLLGTGSTSTVFSSENDQFAIKVTSETLATREANFLQKLKDVPGVPKIVDKQKTFLMTSPVGKSCTKINISDLITTLKECHEKGIFHRDVFGLVILSNKKIKLFSSIGRMLLIEVVQSPYKISVETFILAQYPLLQKQSWVAIVIQID